MGLQNKKSWERKQFSTALEHGPGYLVTFLIEVVHTVYTLLVIQTVDCKERRDLNQVCRTELMAMFL
jgi:hypothetical protein